MQEFYSNGKLLLTAEYVVLDGAMALALPTTFGQSLKIEPFDAGLLKWTSCDHLSNIWFESVFSINENFSSNNSDADIADRILQILRAARKLNPHFLNDNHGYHISTVLDFPKNWGLGSSSTLITNVANWAKVDPYKLLELTFGGSGYDIACAQTDNPLCYRLTDEDRHVAAISFDPPFKDQLYFVYLNKKQNSRDGILQYQKFKGVSNVNSNITRITKRIIKCTDFDEFCELLNEHEALISMVIDMHPIKETHFDDFPGTIKSLGAWGGDFVLACSSIDPTSYFKSKGYATVIPYSEMILHKKSPTE